MASWPEVAKAQPRRNMSGVRQVRPRLPRSHHVQCNHDLFRKLPHFIWTVLQGSEHFHLSLSPSGDLEGLSVAGLGFLVKAVELWW